MPKASMQHNLALMCRQVGWMQVRGSLGRGLQILLERGFEVLHERGFEWFLAQLADVSPQIDDWHHAAHALLDARVRLEGGGRGG